MKDPADLTPEEARDLEARLDAEFPIEGMRLDISMLRFQLENRTKERDEARAQGAADADLVALVLAEGRLAAKAQTAWEREDDGGEVGQWHAARRELRAAVQARLEAEAGSKPGEPEPYSVHSEGRGEFES